MSMDALTRVRNQSAPPEQPFSVEHRQLPPPDPAFVADADVPPPVFSDSSSPDSFSISPLISNGALVFADEFLPELPLLAVVDPSETVGRIDGELGPRKIVGHPNPLDPPPPDYGWVVGAAAIAGFVAVGLLTGGTGWAILGSAALAAGVGVPLRRYLAAQSDPHFEQRNSGIAAEMAWTGGTQLVFGGVLWGATAAAPAIGAGLGTAAKWVGGTGAGKWGASLAESACAKSAQAAWANPFLRNGAKGVVAAPLAWDLTHDRDGNFQPLNMNIDTWVGGASFAATLGMNAAWFFPAVPKGAATQVTISPFHDPYFRANMLPRGLGSIPMVADLLSDRQGNIKWDGHIDSNVGCLSSLYGGNLLLSGVAGVNLNGKDTAVVISLGAYSLFRMLSGEAPSDTLYMLTTGQPIQGADGREYRYNYNELIAMRYIAEAGNFLTQSMIIGKAYYRPDLRAHIAGERGLTYDFATGAPFMSALGWMSRAKDAVMMRTVGSTGFRYTAENPMLRSWNPITPMSGFATGPQYLLGRNASHPWLASIQERVAQNATVLTGFTGNNVLKPAAGYGGRMLNLVYTGVPSYAVWSLGAPLIGMSPGEWGANRVGKMALWSTMGQPLRTKFGGDTSQAEIIAFVTGSLMDATMQQFFNARAGKRHWAPEFHAQLKQYAHADATQRGEIADDVIGMLNTQMTDWSPARVWRGEAYHQFNTDYLATLADEITRLSPEQREAFRSIVADYANRVKSGLASNRDAEAVQVFGAMLGQ